MATVYLAQDKRGRAVAVKVLHEHLRDDPVFRSRFAQEVTTARRVASFCTARVLDAHIRGPLPFIVTEFVDGMSLHDRVTEHGPLTPADTEALAIGVAAALTAIHAVGLVHRDLKPGNVMLSPLGPKVIDFGIAGAADHTTTAFRFGTPGWLAPEQLAGQPGTPATDVYAWGLLIAWAAGGTANPPGAPDLTRVPQRLRPHVQAALSTDPARRPSARQLLLGLCGSDRPAKVQAATAPIAWPPVGWPPGTVPPPGGGTLPAQGLPPSRMLPPKGADHLAAAYAKARRRTRPLPPPPVAPTKVDRRRQLPAAQPVRLPGRRRRSAWKVAVVVVALVLGGLWLAGRLPSVNTGAEAGETGTVPAAPAPARPQEKPARTAQDGSLAFTVTGFHCGDTELGDWPVVRKAKGRFCLVNLSVRNAGKHSGWVFMGSQRLVDTAGKEYGADDWAWAYYEGSRRFTSTVEPGKTAEGTLVFDVPERTRFTKLIVHDTPLSDGTPVSLK